MNKVGKERGWQAITKEHFEFQTGDTGAILIGNPQKVAQKIIRHGEAIGGISSFNFQMDVGLSHKQLLKSIELNEKQVSPLINK